MPLDAQHSIWGLTEETFERGLSRLSEGLCPECGATLVLTTNKDGIPAGRCPVSTWLYRIKRDPEFFDGSRVQMVTEFEAVAEVVEPSDEAQP